MRACLKAMRNALSSRRGEACQSRSLREPFFGFGLAHVVASKNDRPLRSAPQTLMEISILLLDRRKRRAILSGKSNCPGLDPAIP